MQPAYSERSNSILPISSNEANPVKALDIRIFPGIIIEGEGKNWKGKALDGRKFTGYWFRDFLVLQNDADKKDVVVLNWDRTPARTLHREDYIIVNPLEDETLFVL